MGLYELQLPFVSVSFLGAKLKESLSQMVRKIVYVKVLTDTCNSFFGDFSLTQFLMHFILFSPSMILTMIFYS